MNGPKREGSKLEYPEKSPDNQSENRYHILLEVKIHHPNWVLNPHPLTMVISLLVQNTPALTHQSATGCCVIFASFAVAFNQILLVSKRGGVTLLPQCNAWTIWAAFPLGKRAAIVHIYIFYFPVCNVFVFLHHRL